MFAKLLKYEWRSNAATFGVLSACALGVSVLCGVILRVLLHSGARLEGIAAFVLMALLFFGFLALAAYAGAVWIMLLVRFYRNKFTDEGYLTFTLPVSAHQIFLSSVLNMILWLLISLAVLALGILLLGVIALAGLPLPDMQEFFQDFDGLVDAYYPSYYEVLNAVSAVTTLLYATVLPMTCLTIGSVAAKKHKILASFGIYYGINVLVGTLESILMVAASVESVYTQSVDALMIPTMVTGIVTQIVVTVAGYFVSIYLMRRELNLN